MQIILDVGSGRSLPDEKAARAVVEAVAAVDTHKHEIVLKAQLFHDAPPNKPLCFSVFDTLFTYGEEKGYKVTASVFDVPSLAKLLYYPIPFVKIACRPDLYWLVGEVPRKVPVYVSIKGKGSPVELDKYEDVLRMDCVPRYPAEIADYNLDSGLISDHTVGLELFEKAQPCIWEKHFVLKRDPKNPDSGPFAITPDELATIA